MIGLEPRVAVAWNGRCAFQHGRALLPAERQEIRDAVTSLDADMASSLRTETVFPSARKIATMGAGKDTFGADALVDAMIDALPGTPDAALAEATRRILAGEVPDVSKVYMPTTAQLASLPHEIAHGWRLRRDQLAGRLDLSERPAEPPERSFTSEQMATMRVRMERLAAGAAARARVRQPAAPEASAGVRATEDLHRKAKDRLRSNSGAFTY